MDHLLKGNAFNMAAPVEEGWVHRSGCLNSRLESPVRSAPQHCVQDSITVEPCSNAETTTSYMAATAGRMPIRTRGTILLRTTRRVSAIVTSGNVFVYTTPWSYGAIKSKYLSFGPCVRSYGIPSRKRKTADAYSASFIHAHQSSL